MNRNKRIELYFECFVNAFARLTNASNVKALSALFLRACLFGHSAHIKRNCAWQYGLVTWYFLSFGRDPHFQMLAVMVLSRVANFDKFQ